MGKVAKTSEPPKTTILAVEANLPLEEVDTHDTPLRVCLVCLVANIHKKRYYYPSG